MTPCNDAYRRYSTRRRANTTDSRYLQVRNQTAASLLALSLLLMINTERRYHEHSATRPLHSQVANRAKVDRQSCLLVICSDESGKKEKAQSRRDSARRRSLRRSRSFKVTDVSTNRKPVCDFLLVNNTNVHPISHRFPVIAQYWLLTLSYARPAADG